MIDKHLGVHRHIFDENDLGSFGLSSEDWAAHLYCDIENGQERFIWPLNIYIPHSSTRMSSSYWTYFRSYSEAEKWLKKNGYL